MLSRFTVTMCIYGGSGGKFIFFPGDLAIAGMITIVLAC